jgi:hypothetical protein
VVFVATKKVGQTFFPSPLLLFDPGWIKIGIRDKHSGSATLPKGFLASSLHYLVASAGKLNINFFIEKKI